MNDALLVRRFECFGNLHGDRQRLVHRNRSARDALVQRLAVDQFHDQQRRLAKPGPYRPIVVTGFGRALDGVVVVPGFSRAFSGLLDLRDMRMVQRRRDLRLALEVRDALRIADELRRQHLDGDVAPEPRCRAR
jgi:hypothetical protein